MKFKYISKHPDTLCLDFGSSLNDTSCKAMYFIDCKVMYSKIEESENFSNFLNDKLFLKYDKINYANNFRMK